MTTIGQKMRERVELFLQGTIQRTRRNRVATIGRHAKRTVGAACFVSQRAETSSVFTSLTPRRISPFAPHVPVYGASPGNVVNTRGGPPSPPARF